MAGKPRSTEGEVRSPDAVDKALGVRLRALRLERGLSQIALAEQIGVSFQQLQKYERATNRMSVSMAVRAAHALGVALGDLVEDAQSHGAFDGMINCLATPGAAELLTAYSAMKMGRQRAALLDLAQLLVPSSDK